MKGEPPVPADQFQRVEKEMAKLLKLVEEVRNSIDTSEGLQRIEARRALYEASASIEIGQFWITKAIAAARRSDEQ